MEIELSDKTLNRISAKDREKFDLEEDKWGRTSRVYLNNWTVAELEHLEAIITKAEGDNWRNAVAIIKKYREVLAGKNPPATGAKQMEQLLKNYLAFNAPELRLYQMIDGSWYGYYVDYINYSPEFKSRDSYHPAHVDMRVEFVAYGKKMRRDFCWQTSECRCSAPALLAREQLFVETPEIRAEYDRQLARYGELVVQIGRQCLGRGRILQPV